MVWVTSWMLFKKWFIVPKTNSSPRENRPKPQKKVVFRTHQFSGVNSLFSFKQCRGKHIENKNIDPQRISLQGTHPKKTKLSLPNGDRSGPQGKAASPSTTSSLTMFFCSIETSQVWGDFIWGIWRFKSSHSLDIQIYLLKRCFRCVLRVQVSAHKLFGCLGIVNHTLHLFRDPVGSSQVCRNTSSEPLQRERWLGKKKGFPLIKFSSHQNLW